MRDWIGRIDSAKLAQATIIGIAELSIASCTYYNKPDDQASTCEYMLDPVRFKGQKLDFAGDVWIDKDGRSRFYGLGCRRDMPVRWESGSRPPASAWEHARLGLDGHTPLRPDPPHLDVGHLTGRLKFDLIDGWMIVAANWKTGVKRPM